LAPVGLAVGIGAFRIDGHAVAFSDVYPKADAPVSEHSNYLRELAEWIDDYESLVQQRIDAERIQLEGVR
jgi:hypothetical protein